MSQRNPMNERYTTEAKAGGHTRKSAASAKPKSSAAASVVMGSSKKKPAKNAKNQPKSKRERKREERNKQYEAERRYGDPPTRAFKIAKRMWIGFLVASVVTVALSFVASRIEGLPE